MSEISLDRSEAVDENKLTCEDQWMIFSMATQHPIEVGHELAEIGYKGIRSVIRGMAERGTGADAILSCLAKQGLLDYHRPVLSKLPFIGGFITKSVLPYRLKSPSAPQHDE